MSLQHLTWYYDSVGAIHAVGEVANGTNSTADFVQMTANFYSASNQLLTTSFGYSCLNALGAGGVSPFDVLLISPPAGVDHVTVYVSSYHSPPLLYAVPPGLSATIDNLYFDIGGVYHIVGTITNHSANTYNFVKACSAIYDSSGNVLRAKSWYTTPDTLGSGQTGTYDSLEFSTSGLIVDHVKVWPDASYP